MHGSLGTDRRISGADVGDAALAALLAATARQDRDALRTLYVRTSSRLFGVALAILRDRDAAADTLQDGFVRVWLRAGQYDPGRGAPMAWLSGIVRHLALDAARARGREQLVGPLDDAAYGMAVSLDPSALDVLATGRDAGTLHLCLGTLDERSRAVLVLAYLQGLSHAQVAARIDRPLGTVKTWIRASLQRLRTCMQSAQAPT